MCRCRRKESVNIQVNQCRGRDWNQDVTETSTKPTGWPNAASGSGSWRRSQERWLICSGWEPLILRLRGTLAPHSPSNPFELQSIVTDCCWCGTLVCCIPMVHFNRVRCSLLSDLWVVFIADNTQLINLDESATALILRRFSDFCWGSVAAFTLIDGHQCKTAVQKY